MLTKGVAYVEATEVAASVKNIFKYIFYDYFEAKLVPKILKIAYGGLCPCNPLGGFRQPPDPLPR